LAEVHVGTSFLCLACQKELLVPTAAAVDEDLVDDLEIEEEPGGAYGLAGDYSPAEPKSKSTRDLVADEEPEFVDEDDELPEYFVAVFPPGDRTLKPKETSLRASPHPPVENCTWRAPILLFCVHPHR
jgi:hypothetical protein